VLFVVLALLGGPGLVIYLLMGILVPEEPQGTA
jgi:phage shock protein PspC (stress-responsive transcriptional regulator)